MDQYEWDTDVSRIKTGNIILNQYFPVWGGSTTSTKAEPNDCQLIFGGTSNNGWKLDQRTKNTSRMQFKIYLVTYTQSFQSKGSKHNIPTMLPANSYVSPSGDGDTPWKNL